MSDEHGPAAPAGWYPTPNSGQRYWDGAQWLELPQPETVAAEAPSVTPLHEGSPPRGRSRKWWLAVAAVIAVLIMAGIAFAATRPKTPNLQAAFNACDPMKLPKSHIGDPGVHLVDNGATLTVDTAGEKELVGATEADLACVLAAVEAPASVTANMGSTRALDGTQTATWDGITATWRYHPDTGFELVLTTN